MKSVLCLLSFIACIANAQEIKVKGIKQLTPDRSGEYTVSGISPDGKQLLATQPNLKGLYLIDIKSGKTRTITSLAGAGYQPVFSAGGRYISFKSDDFSTKKRVSTLHEIDLLTDDTMAPGLRERDILLTETAAEKDTFVLLENLSPVLSLNGTKRTFKPGGDGSYIWVSLSPDKTKLLYHLVGKGTFICDLDGKIIASPGKLNAPKWLNNLIVIGMDDRDDGAKVTSSDLIACFVNTGKKINLTSTGKRNEMYPYPFPDGKGIAFRTSEGELYIMKLKVK